MATSRQRARSGHAGRRTRPGRRPAATSRSRPTGAAAQGRAADDAGAARSRGRASARRGPSRPRTCCARACASSACPIRASSSCSARPATSPTARSSRRSYQLWRTNLLPHEFVLLAIGRRPYDDETFRAEVRASLDEFSRVQPLDEDGLARRSPSGSATTAATSPTPAGFDALADAARRAWTWSTGRAATGCSTWRPSRRRSPRSSPSSGGSGSTTRRHDGGWRRVVIEKPFGHDLDSAKRLNREVGKVFRESQVYRIDHYLGKETVRNLLVFRFGNGIFEPLWNRRYVDHVQITVAESIGIEDRGAFYEETGASRDVLQNHLLQLLSLVAMEPPATFEADALRDEKVKVLRAIAERPAPRSADDVVRGQYGPGWVAASRSRATARSPRSTRSRRPRRSSPRGSRSTTGAGPASRSTSGRASACPSARPRSRSSSGRSRTACSRTRAPTPSRTCSRSGSSRTRGSCCGSAPRCPGLGLDIRPVTMDFTYGSAFTVDSPDAYETLILDALLGDASLFTRADEVEEAWCIVDPIIDAWADGAGARVPELRRRHLGPGGGRRADRARRPALAADLTRPRCRRPIRAPHAGQAIDAGHARRAGPALVVARAQHRRDRDASWPGSGPSQDLTAEVDGEPGRHIAARTSVMNLVVIARRPEVGERGAATIQALTGRHPSRTIVVQSADPDGPSWLDAQIQAHCMLPRDDAPETCAEMIYLTAGGETGRHLAAIVAPLLIHDLPVTVWWPGEPPFAAGRPTTCWPWPTASSSTARPGPATGSTGCASMAELVAGRPRLAVSDFALAPPVALARGDRLDLRPAGLPAVPALAAPDRGHLRDPRRDRRGRVDEPRQAALPRRLAGVAART